VTNPSGGLLTYRQAAERLGLSHRTVQKLCAEGLIEAVRFGRRAVRFEPAEIERFIDSRRSPKGQSA